MLNVLVLPNNIAVPCSDSDSELVRLCDRIFSPLIDLVDGIARRDFRAAGWSKVVLGQRYVVL